MKKLLIYLKDYKAQTVLAPLFKMLEALLELFVPLVVKNIIDTGIAQSDKSYILKMCGVLAALAAVGLAFSVTAQYFAARAAVGFSKKLRHELFRHIGLLSYAELDTLGASALITRMTSDINQVQSGVNMTLRLLLRSPFVVVGAVVMAFTVDSRSALVFAGAVPVLCVLVFAIMFAGIPMYKAVQKKLDAVMGTVRQSLSGVRVLRAFGREAAQADEFKSNTASLCSSQQKAGRVTALMNPVTFVAINAAIIVLIQVGAVRVNSGLLTQGAVIALYNYMSQILIELIKFADLIVNITKSTASAARIRDVFETEPSMSYPESPADIKKSDTAVEFKSVSLRYSGAGDYSLENISFSVKPGEKIGVIGSTGSGKTSLVNLIPRFYDATQGEVLLFGKNVKEYTDSQLNSLVAVVPQRAVLFSGSIRDNLLWGNGKASDAALLEAVGTAQAEDILKAKNGGLDEVLEEGGLNLSGGQKQRLTIARALVKKAPILILDDSSSALDLATDLHLRNAIERLDNSPAVFIVSQRTSSVMKSDKILVMEDGELSACGTHEELLKSSDVYREIYNSQFGGGEHDA